MQDVGAWATQHRWNRAAAPTSKVPTQVANVAEACMHAQTQSRSLIVTCRDTLGQQWEVLASPMRLARTPPQIGGLIGAPSREHIAWHTRQAYSVANGENDEI
jgi:crotonobetainyl-CoA:carnitine CoA-transferase CaiB-like acyl-CoA transferase